MLGDFNIDRQDDPNWQAFTSTGLRPPAELTGSRARSSTTPRGRPGQVLLRPIAWFFENGESKLELGYTGRAGRFDFVPVVLTGLTRTEQSWRMSDHYPLWAEFRIRAC